MKLFFNRKLKQDSKAGPRRPRRGPSITWSLLHFVKCSSFLFAKIVALSANLADRRAAEFSFHLQESWSPADVVVSEDASDATILQDDHRVFKTAEDQATAYDPASEDDIPSTPVHISPAIPACTVRLMQRSDIHDGLSADPALPDLLPLEPAYLDSESFDANLHVETQEEHYSGPSEGEVECTDLDLLFGLAEILVEPIYAQLLGYNILTETVFTTDNPENERHDKILAELTDRVVDWFERLKLIEYPDGRYGPRGAIVPLALWIIWQIPLTPQLHRPIHLAGSTHSPQVEEMQELCSRTFSRDGDEIVDAAERMLVLGLSLAQRSLDDHNDDKLLRDWHTVSGIPLHELNRMDVLAIQYLQYDINPRREPYIDFLHSLLRIHTLWHIPSGHLKTHEILAREALEDTLWEARGVPVRHTHQSYMEILDNWDQDSEEEGLLETPDLDSWACPLHPHAGESKEHEQLSRKTQECGERQALTTLSNLEFVELQQPSRPLLFQR